MKRCTWVLMIVALCLAPALHAEAIHVAVASNFVDTLRDIAKAFEKDTGNTVLLSAGATGKHYAQIKNGAPLDLFFAADVKRPALLEAEGAAVPDTRFTYALGRIVLWSPEAGYVDSEGAVLNSTKSRHLAIANPKLAPYGMAAQQVMEARGVWDALRPRIVMGENISQAYQFTQSGNAELGFVALSQIKGPGREPRGSYWQPPASLYEPIEQQAVLLKDSLPARAFLDFVRGEAAAKIIRSYGYELPEPKKPALAAPVKPVEAAAR